MHARPLGATGLSVSPIVLGTWAVGGGYWGAADDERSIAAIRAALDAGVTAIDTAPFYGLGRSERVVGRALAGRSDVLLATKVGLRWDDDRGEFFFDATDERGRALRVFRNGRPDSVRHEVEQSLARLGVEHLHLVQVHWPDATTPVADTLGALAELHRAGTIGAIGVSNFGPALLREAQEALGDIPLASVQSRYSLVHRELEQDVLPHARAHGLAVLAYSPLEQGLLTGEVTPSRRFHDGDGRRRRPTFQRENRRRVNALVQEVLAPVAAAHGRSCAQVALAWTVAQPGVTAAVVGARDARQAAENAAAGDLALSPDELSAIDRAFAGLELLQSEV